MRAQALRRRGGSVILWAAAAALAAGCGTASAADLSAAGPTSAGGLSFGQFPASWDGGRALRLCEDWAGLRAEYVRRVGQDSRFELEQWFSTRAWRPAFNANSPLKVDPAYQYISSTFGLVTAADAASVDSAQALDQACAAAD
jgi:hypothetical protein